MDQLETAATSTKDNLLVRLSPMLLEEIVNPSGQPREREVGLVCYGSEERYCRLHCGTAERCLGKIQRSKGSAINVAVFAKFKRK